MLSASILKHNLCPIPHCQMLSLINASNNGFYSAIHIDLRWSLVLLHAVYSYFIVGLITNETKLKLSPFVLMLQSIKHKQWWKCKHSAGGDFKFETNHLLWHDVDLWKEINGKHKSKDHLTVGKNSTNSLKCTSLLSARDCHNTSHSHFL